MDGHKPAAPQNRGTRSQDIDRDFVAGYNFDFVGSTSVSSLNNTDDHSQYDKPQYAAKFQEAVYEKNIRFRHSDSSLSSPVNRSRILDRSPSLCLFNDWWLELLACIFITGALVALCVTAYSYQNRPLPSWPRWITLNSLLAIYTVILKTAILFILAQGLSHMKWSWFTKARPLTDIVRYDNASRGPLGSAGLLWVLRGRDLISSIGAVVIVVAVVLDPVAQQVIRYFNCPQPLPSSNATVSRTNAFMDTGLHIAAGISTIPTALQSAINGGIFVPGATDVSYECSSGNCTFSKPFSTVGFTSQCEDVSNELTFANVTASFNYTDHSDDSSNGAARIVTQNITTLNATLPSGLSTGYSINGGQFATYMVSNYNTSTSVFEIILGPNTMSPHANDNFCSSRSNSSGNDSNVPWYCRGYGAARCTIKPAIFSVRSNITSGKLREIVTLQTTSFAFASSAQSTVDISCPTREQKSALTGSGYKFPLPNEPQWLPYNVSLYYDYMNDTIAYQGNRVNMSESIKKIVPPHCIYQLSLTSINSLNQFFQGYLSGAINPSGPSWTGTSTVVQQFYDARGTTFASVNSIFQNISIAMTTYARNNGWANNSAPAQGEMWHTETCVQVRWAWLSFPAVLAVLTLVFFVAMVIETRKAQQGVHHDFKSSPLALLFHGLDEQAQQRLETSHLGESNEVHDLNQEAKNMYVRLRPTEKGWRFVTEHDDLR